MPPSFRCLLRQDICLQMRRFSVPGCVEHDLNGRNNLSVLRGGQRMLTPQILCALAKFHGVSVDYLLELTDAPGPYSRRR